MIPVSHRDARVDLGDEPNPQRVDDLAHEVGSRAAFGGGGR
jgi:hypothetical protein